MQPSPTTNNQRAIISIQAVAAANKIVLFIRLLLALIADVPAVARRDGRRRKKEKASNKSQRQYHNCQFVAYFISFAHIAEYNHFSRQLFCRPQPLWRPSIGGYRCLLLFGTCTAAIRKLIILVSFDGGQVVLCMSHSQRHG